MTPELIAILSVGVAGFVELAGLMLAPFTRIERRMDRIENCMDRMESRMQTLGQGQAELKGVLDVIRDVPLQRTAS
jgi:hypothetical protein